MSSLRAIANAQTTYALTYPDVGYADVLTKLSDPPVGQPISPAHGGILDWVLGCAAQPCPKSGYQFSVINPAGAPINTYSAVGTPITLGQTGRRGFCSDQASRVTYDPAGTSSCTTPLE